MISSIKSAVRHSICIRFGTTRALYMLFLVCYRLFCANNSRVEVLLVIKCRNIVPFQPAMMILFVVNERLRQDDVYILRGVSRGLSAHSLQHPVMFELTRVVR